MKPGIILNAVEEQVPLAYVGPGGMSFYGVYYEGMDEGILRILKAADWYGESEKRLVQVMLDHLDAPFTIDMTKPSLPGWVPFTSKASSDVYGVIVWE